MMKRISIACGVLMVAASAAAGPGHDHGEEATRRSTGLKAPRFATHTESFEVVGVVEGEKLVLYLDYYDSNEPVTNAKVEVESGPFKAIAQLEPERGAYTVPSEPFRQAGSHPLQIAVVAGTVTDLLGADLVVPEAHTDADHAQDSGVFRQFAANPTALATGGAVVVLLLGWLWMRRGRRGVA